jgi:hypothetical protein
MPEVSAMPGRGVNDAGHGPKAGRREQRRRDGVSNAARRRDLVRAGLPADVCFSLVSAMRNPQLAALP